MKIISTLTNIGTPSLQLAPTQLFAIGNRQYIYIYIIYTHIIIHVSMSIRNTTNTNNSRYHRWLITVLFDICEALSVLFVLL